MAKLGEWHHVDTGITRRIFQPGQELMTMEIAFEPDAEIKLHEHPHEQLSYCMKGSVEFTVDGKTVVLKEGETISILGNVIHGVKALEASTLLESFTPLREDLLEKLK